MKVFLIGGFLGSGKTTAIQQACNMLRRAGARVGVITNDQGEGLVDTGFFQHHGIAVNEVTNGCFCCNYTAFTEALLSLQQTAQPDVIFAEAVGSCTDLIATIATPLQSFAPHYAIVLSVLADAELLASLLSGNASFLNDDVRYIYKQQLAEAVVLVLNKVDLIPPELLQYLQQQLQEEYRDKKMLVQNSYHEPDIEQWLAALHNVAENKHRPSLELDYDRYAAGEAALAWLNEDVQIQTDNNAYPVAADLMQRLHAGLQQYAIGHLKFLIQDSNVQQKISFTTLRHDAVAAFKQYKAPALLLRINARIQTDPQRLQTIVTNVIDAIRADWNCKITVQKSAAFQPTYPKPTYRFAT